MEKWNWTVLRAGEDHLTLKNGFTLRILSAMEVLKAHREAETLSGAEPETALCANACLLARALEKHGKPVYPDGRAVLNALSPVRIAALCKRWAEWSSRENPSPTNCQKTVDALKKVWSTRLMRAFNGVCSALSARFPQRRGFGQ
ncbi:MAG: hypothetical protein LKK00_05795 [Intestinimonas sp.]|jgi:hypothetical protein|nr:hypothetical protein [Intestinimonas sp.]